MELVYIGIGSNLGDRKKNLKEAVTRLDARDSIKLTKVSSSYLTEPIGGPPQPWYYNAIVEVRTSLTPRDLLSVLREIERGMGRKRRERNSPRIIDLDILFFGGRVIEADDLKVPHPRALERRFVLEPLVEIAADLTHPSAGGAMKEWLEKLEEPGTVVKKGLFYGF